MPWWSWILIWTGLVLGLLAMLAWLGYRLFKKVMAAAEALEQLGSQVAELGLDVAEPAPDRFRPAFFQDYEEVAAVAELRRVDRAHRRQLRRDHLIARSKLLQQPSSIRRTDPHA